MQNYNKNYKCSHAVRAQLGTILFTGRPPFLDPLTLHLKVIKYFAHLSAATLLNPVGLVYSFSMFCNVLLCNHNHMMTDVQNPKCNILLGKYLPPFIIISFLRRRLLP